MQMESVVRSAVQPTTDAPVMVTGASGYVAGWVVKGLLELGVTVHATVRDSSKPSSVNHLKAAANVLPGTLKFFDANLLNEGDFDEAMKGCEIVIHTASPFTQHVKDPQRDLIDPALKGTRNVLGSVEKTASVKRVVLTSSIAAMYTDAVECEHMPGGMLSPESWNTTASLTYEPYHYSKTLAERAAWELQRQGRGWELVVINPALVVGPSLNPVPTSESFGIVRQLMRGDMMAGAPRLGLSLVDVRDVAEGHIAAAFVPEANGRNIIAGKDCDLCWAGMELRKYLPVSKAWRLPRWPMPKAAFVVLAPAVGVSRQFAENNVDHVVRCDTTKSREELGITYRDPIEAMAHMTDQL